MAAASRAAGENAPRRPRGQPLAVLQPAGLRERVDDDVLIAAEREPGAGRGEPRRRRAARRPRSASVVGQITTAAAGAGR